MYTFKLICFVAFISLSEQHEIVFDDIRPNRFVPLHVMKRIENTELLKCLQACVLKFRCQSVNYNFNRKLCKLLMDSLVINDMCVEEYKEWIYYGSLQVAQAMSTHIPGVCLTEERPVTGALISQIPTLSKSWQISVDIKPLSFKEKYGNVLDLKTAADARIWILYFTPSTLDLHIDIYLNGKEPISKFLTTLPLNVYISVTVMKTNVQGTYTLKVFVNGTQCAEIVDDDPQPYSNLDLYNGIVNWNADAVTRNILVKNL